MGGGHREESQPQSTRKMTDQGPADRFHTEAFIDQVEKRPPIWDTSCAHYKNKVLKKRCWEELVNIFCTGDTHEKKALAVILQKKWKSLRDCYSRELKKHKTLPSGSKARHATYIHFKRLNFLENSVSGKETISNLHRNNDDVLSNDDVTTQRGATGTSTKKKMKMDSDDKHFVDILEKSLLERRKQEEQWNDDDKLFCLSLYKELKKVPEDYRLRTKIEILNVIQHAQACVPSHAMYGINHPPPYNQSFAHTSGHTSQPLPLHSQLHPAFPLQGVTSYLSTTHLIHQAKSQQSYPSTSGYSTNTSIQNLLAQSPTPSQGGVSSISDTQSEYVNVFE